MRPVRRLRGLAAARDGVSAIEFALVGMFLAVLCIGIIDFGRGIWEYVQVGNAARAGADYAAMHGYDPANPAPVEAAAEGATSIGNLNIASRMFYGCPSSSGVTEETGGYICASGNEAAQYAEIDTSVPYSPIFAYPGIPNPMTISAKAYARLY